MTEAMLVLIPATALIVEAIKRADFLNERYLPVLSILIACIFGYFYNVDVLNSIIVGAAASGLYDLTTKTILNN